MRRPTKIVGRTWVILDSHGNRIDNVDTDQIYHNSHLAITDLDQMGQHAFGNLAGWKEFPRWARRGDIIVVGRNFGAGSSRQQAVDCFISLGIALIVGESFGLIYWRNAINSGFPIVACPDIASRCGSVDSKDELEVDLPTGQIVNRTKGLTIPGGYPFSRVQMDIYQAGGLLAFGKYSSQTSASSW